jgi:hypothetical protein
MRKFRIRPHISGLIPVWELEEKHGLKWVHVFKDIDLNAVRKMKDHLLQPPTIYTLKNNHPEAPLRNRPSSWQLNPKPKFLKIKRQDLPESLKNID